VKIAKDGFRRERMVWLALIAFALAARYPALAQQDGTDSTRGRSFLSRNKGRDKVNLGDIKVPPVQPAAIPVNPSDAIALVNGQIISRQQLADECVARKGKEILDLLINRTLIEQGLRSQKLEVTGADIDQEIESVARRFGIDRPQWLATLEKERGISPLQYARDIVYPALALRKLCAGRVQVTPKDMQDAFEAQFSERLRVRMIMLDKEQTAIAIWEELKKNPGGFEKIAQERSMDQGSRSLGGLIADPISRHSSPQTLSDSAFRQLVDGDPKDKDPSHKPKDGDFTGVIQYGEEAWVILRRESLIPAAKNVDLKDQRIRKHTYDMIYEAKLKEVMGAVFQELFKRAAIENKLTGTLKMANEEEHPDYQKAKSEIDGRVKLMSDPDGSAPPASRSGAASAPADGSVQRANIPPPAALSPEAAKQFQGLNPPVQPANPGNNGPN
jgi:parvulin-like peptidyl-prolyl isomerase